MQYLETLEVRKILFFYQTLQEEKRKLSSIYFRNYPNGIPLHDIKILNQAYQIAWVSIKLVD